MHLGSTKDRRPGIVINGPDQSPLPQRVCDMRTDQQMRRAEMEPNARLISAAPELLEALRGTMKALSRMIDKHDPDSIEAEWIGEAHEAIAKATTPNA